MITIRLATDADMPALVKLNDEVQELHASLLPDLFKTAAKYNPMPTLQQFTTDKKFRTLVAYSGDTLVGYLAMVLKDSPGNDFYHARRYACINHIATSKGKQRQGIGRALMDAARAMAREFGASRLELDVFSMNAVARKFFASQGFATFNEKMESQL